MWTTRLVSKTYGQLSDRGIWKIGTVVRSLQIDQKTPSQQQVVQHCFLRKMVRHMLVATKRGGMPLKVVACLSEKISSFQERTPTSMKVQERSKRSRYHVRSRCLCVQEVSSCRGIARLSNDGRRCSFPTSQLHLHSHRWRRMAVPTGHVSMVRCHGSGQACFVCQPTLPDTCSGAHRQPA